MIIYRRLARYAYTSHTEAIEAVEGTGICIVVGEAEHVGAICTITDVVYGFECAGPVATYLSCIAGVKFVCVPII